MTDNGVDTMFAYSPIGFNGGTGLDEGVGIGLPGLVQGIEYYGVAAHRLFYTVGITNGLAPTDPDVGTFDGNSRKDAYARIDYKFGGMGLDGDTKGKSLPAENWREKSLRIGALAYRGDGRDVNFVVTDDGINNYNQQDRTFDRVGGYLSWYMGDLNVFGVVLHGTDTLQRFDTGTGPMVMNTGALLEEINPSFDSWFVQADYVIRPPFQVSVRYESLNPSDPSVESIKFWNTNFSFLTRANVKMMAEYRWDANESLNNTLAGVLRFAY